jgi:hypothetical protein
MPYDNPLLNTKKAKDILSRLDAFVNQSETNMDLIFLFGIAPELDYVDRNRFASAVQYFLKKEPAEASRQKLFICIDPNLTDRYIGEAFSKLSKSFPKPYVFYGDTSVLQFGGTTNNDYREIVGKYGPDLDFTDKRPPKNNDVRVYSIKFGFQHEYDSEDESVINVTYHFCFLRYGVEPKRKNPLEMGTFKSNQVNIQGIRGNEKKKTIQSYLTMDVCQYDPDSFFGRLQTLGLNKQIQDIYLASAMNSHDSPMLQQIINNKPYTSRKGKAGTFLGTLGNRYFEDSCEILTLLNNLSQTKAVLFLQLDKDFHVFSHKDVPNYSDVPYIVPFNNDTTFFIDSPPDFIRGGLSQGGRRNKTRKERRKNKKTRKQLY